MVHKLKRVEAGVMVVAVVVKLARDSYVRGQAPSCPYASDVDPQCSMLQALARPFQSDGALERRY